MNTATEPFQNPFRPGAGHKPPYLAGREKEETAFRKLLQQTLIMDNLVLTGLRGVGKTVLLDSFKPIAMLSGWLWVGTDLSESASVSEESLALRILTDLSVVTKGIYIGKTKQLSFGFTGNGDEQEISLGFDTLLEIYNTAPGLVSDKLKAVLLFVAPFVAKAGKKGIVFAYDEAQNLADHASDKQYPLSILLEVFQSIQRQNVPFMLALVGLPTLVQKLVEARTYAERMFTVIILRRLSEDESKQAIEVPISKANCPVKFTGHGIAQIIQYSGGYPYFIQFICREAYDSYLQRTMEGKPTLVPMEEIVRKLDNDFFAGRWAKVTDRQQDLLHVISQLETANDEFTIKEIVDKSERMTRPFGKSQINQMLQTLIMNGLVYKDRHGKYVFAVPLMADFIKRTIGASVAFPSRTGS